MQQLGKKAAVEQQFVEQGSSASSFLLMTVAVAVAALRSSCQCQPASQLQLNSVNGVNLCWMTRRQEHHGHGHITGL